MNYDKNKYCSKKCEVMSTPKGVCDFCKFYDFGNEEGVYTGNGYYTLLDEEREPYDGCSEFVYFKVE